MTTPHVPTLLSLLDDEDLIRLRKRVEKFIEKAEKRDKLDEVAAAGIWFNIFDAEIQRLKAEHKAKCKK